jgi:staphylococcal nuclease domain-containing protein 1
VRTSATHDTRAHDRPLLLPPSLPGDIAIELLKRGLGRIADYSFAFAPSVHVAAMRAAERSAKASQLRVWRDHVAAAPALAVGEREFPGTVIEVVSGDTVVVAVARGPAGLAGPTEERRVTLACVKAPRAGRRDEPEAPWAFEVRQCRRCAEG